MSYSPDERGEKSGQEPADSVWPKTETFPGGDSFVLLVFHGLMGFSYNQGRNHCEVGIHAKAPQHNFRIVVYEFSGGPEPHIIWERGFGEAGSLPKNFLRLEIDNPAAPGVKFYMPGRGGEEAGGIASARDDHDFRRVPDFEGPDFYDRRLTKKPEAFKPVFTVDGGTFFTLLPTKKFKLVGKKYPGGKPLGRIAWLIGNLISLGEGGSVALRFNDAGLNPPPLTPDAGRGYLVLVDNSCPINVCKYEPRSTARERRNDFYLYYETFELPDGEEEYELHLDEGADGSTENPRESDAEGSVGLKAVSNLAPFLNKLAETLSNDEAPCGGAGYGKSGGI